MLDVKEMLAAGVLTRASDMAAPGGWNLERMLGSLVELSGTRSGATSMAAGLVWQAQARREACAWAASPLAVPYPPDLAAVGIDLAALAVLRTEEPLDAAEHLVRSGGFGLVVVDCARRSLPASRLARLEAPARRHGVAVLLLTRKAPGEASLGALISLHVHVRRERAERQERVGAGAAGDGEGAGFACHVAVQKDKRRGRPWEHVEAADGPPGLR